MKVDIEDINVSERFREEYEGIEELAESIDEHGLIQPIVVADDMTLIAGERRLRACKKLDKDEVEVRKLDNVPALKRKELELQENLYRKDFTWEEEVKAKEKLHLMKQIQHGGKEQGSNEGEWGMEETAEEIEESLGNVSQDIQLSKALEEYPELKKCDNKSRAWKKYEKIKERKANKELAEDIGNKSVGELYNLYNRNCLEWMKEQEKETYDLVIADPPWGIDMDKRRKNRDHHSELEYEDNMDQLLLLWDDSINLIHDLLKEEAHLYLFFGVRHYDLIKEMIKSSGFEFDDVPLVWNKDHGGSAAKGRTYPKAWESVFFCYKGKRDIKTGTHNVFTYKRPSNNDRIHSAQKSVPLLEEWINNSTDPDDKILDPFAGSGSTVVAGVKNQRRVDAVEKDEANFVQMKEWVEEKLAEDKVQKELGG